MLFPFSSISPHFYPDLLNSSPNKRSYHFPYFHVLLEFFPFWMQELRYTSVLNFPVTHTLGLPSASKSLWGLRKSWSARVPVLHLSSSSMGVGSFSFLPALTFYD
jgi:hypothetical protein